MIVKDVMQLYEKPVGRQAKVSHLPLAMLKVMKWVIRPLRPELSQIIQSAIYIDTTDCTFDPAPMLAAYPVKLTGLADWAAQRVEQGAAALSLTQV